MHSMVRVLDDYIRTSYMEAEGFMGWRGKGGWMAFFVFVVYDFFGFGF